MSATGRADERGFTLLEMLVVLAVMGLISGIAFPAIERSAAHQQFRHDVAATEAILRGARATAIGQAGRVAVNAQDAPATVSVTLPRGQLHFYADGSSDGGSVVIAQGTRRVRLEIDAGTGLIRRAS